jgi:hypothetical protein
VNDVDQWYQALALADCDTLRARLAECRRERDEAHVTADRRERDWVRAEAALARTRDDRDAAIRRSEVAEAEAAKGGARLLAIAGHFNGWANGGDLDPHAAVAALEAVGGELGTIDDIESGAWRGKEGAR